MGLRTLAGADIVCRSPEILSAPRMSAHLFRFFRRLKWTALGLAALLLLAGCAAGDPDADELGRAQGYPLGTPQTMYAEPFKVGSFSATDRIFSTRAVPHGQTIAPLEKHLPVEITYTFGDQRYTLDDYLRRRRATGLLVLKGNQIVCERYHYGRTERDRFLSFSMAKSVTSMLIGKAVQLGMIRSLDDRAEAYVPELKGSAYGGTTLRQLLRMSSGVQFVEEYNGKDDMARLYNAQTGHGIEHPLEVLASLKIRAAPAGERFHYSTAETTVLGYVLSGATKKDLATLTADWIWQPMGAESDAGWNFGADGVEFPGSGFNATLRDYGRLGLLIANDGRAQDQPIIPRDYLLEATNSASHPAAFAPRKATPYYGYGYQFWLFPMRSRTIALLGIYGQCVFVQPESKIVMVQLSVSAEPLMPKADAAERDALWRGVLETLGGHAEP